MSEAETFFASVLPPEGPYVLAYIKNKVVVHKTYSGFAAMATASQRFVSLGADAYLCIGSILDRDFKNEKGKIRPRNQKNIKALKSLILDLDVEIGSDKKFPSKKDALEGLHAFQKAFALPEPTVVDSGYGFHVYFPLEEEVAAQAWTHTAAKLKMVAGLYDSRLTADPTRVSDSSSLLRIPETKNFKNGSTKDVKVLSYGTGKATLEAYDEKFHAFLVEQSVPIPKEREEKKIENKEKSILGSALSVYTDDPHSFQAVLKKCNWAKEYVNHQKTEPEPNWYAMLGMMPYLKTKTYTGLELAHMISKGHPGYTWESTEKKYRQAENAQSGPTLCEKFRGLDFKRCLGCPYAEMVNTPVRLDRVDLPAEAPTVEVEVIKETGEVVFERHQIPAPPKPYFRGKEGGGIYFASGEGDEAEVRRIYEFDIFPVRRLKDEETANEMLEISLTLPMDGHRFIRIPSGLLTDPKKFTAALADKGVLVHPREALTLVTYIIEYARKIQKEEMAHEEFGRFGWRDLDSDNPRFVLGDFVVDSKGDLRRATPAPYLKSVGEVISVKGGLENWKKGFRVYKELDGGQTKPLQFALMMGFAAPLLALTAFNGLIYNMLGDSGSGKSTALRIMTSIWGKPDEHHIQVHDNRIPMFNTIGYLQSIPISFDELTTIASDTLADIAYAISEGRGKNRADRAGNTRANTVQWKTVVCGTSNASLYEKLGMSRSGNNAHAYRIFEVTVNQADLKNRPKIDAALALVESNYGLAGRMYITYVLKNLKEIRKEVLDATVRFAKEFNMPTAERFWFALFACMAVGGTVAKKLGLHDYDIQQIIAWNAEQLNRIREIVTTVEGDAFSTFAHFMQTHLRATLMVTDGKVNPLNMSNPDVQQLLARFEFDGLIPKLGWVAVPAMKDFCKQSQVEYGWMLKRLQDAGLILSIEPKRLGEGTPMLTGQTKCWKIDLNHPIMQGKIV